MNLDSLARPYAQAAFEFSVEHDALPFWGEHLQAAAALANHPEVSIIFHNPNVSNTQRRDFFIETLNIPKQKGVENFFHLLADNQRLFVLPQIYQIFSHLREAYEKTMTVDIESAMPLSEEQKQAFSEALEKRLYRKINMNCSVDKEIYGGAIIRAGDLVIDGSGRGRLALLKEQMKGRDICN